MPKKPPKSNLPAGRTYAAVVMCAECGKPHQATSDVSADNAKSAANSLATICKDSHRK